jgi:peptidoglycan/xylan/chitin deacetylase (PgdA/CDA1 family)
VVAVRQFVKHTLHAAGFHRRRLAERPYAGVAVLTYHGVRDDRWPAGVIHFEELHVTAARLAEHCETLRALDCSVISLSEWTKIRAGTSALPPRAVMLTFDDGYRSVLTHALPILERHRMPAAVFVCTGPVERGERFWPDAVAACHGEAAAVAAKSLDHAAWRAIVAEAATPAAADDPHAPLAVEELRELARSPLITVGAHTVSHPILGRAPSAIQREEIVAAKATLERWLDRRIESFAYPNGRPGIDYDACTVGHVRDAGFVHAFTTAERFAAPDAPPLEQPRFTMLQGIRGAELAHRLAVSWPRGAALAS